jgi:hypothetical protein
MHMRDVQVAGWIGLCGITLVANCSSADKAGPELGDGSRPDQRGADSAAPVDAPVSQQALDVSTSLDIAVDSAEWEAPSPRSDAPLQIVDGPSGEDGLTRPDGRYFTIPDGRQFLQVDYCLPVLPLSSGRLPCPPTLDGAKAALRSALDAGVLDALPPIDGRPEMSEPCVEPVVAYLPYGGSLGWSTACYYDSNSGQLLSITAGSDTPTECVDSPAPNTASFTAQVYGQFVTCTWPGLGRG